MVTQFTATEREVTMRRFSARSPGQTNSYVRTRVIEELRTRIPGYMPRPVGSYRRFYRENWERTRARAVRANPQAPSSSTPATTVADSDDDVLLTSDSDSDDDVGLIIPPVPPPPPPQRQQQQSRKRSIAQIYSLEELEEEQKRVLEEFTRRKVEIEQESIAMPACPVCKLSIDEEMEHTPVVASCGHIFCTQCYISICSTPLARYSQRHHKCPVCREGWNKPNNVFVMAKGSTVSQCKQRHQQSLTATN